MKIKINTFFLIMACMLPLVGQELNIESLFDSDFEVEEQSAIIEELYGLLENPLDVNKADFYTLQKIPWISTFAARELVEYRKQHKIRDITELQNIKGFEQNFYIIRRFLTVEKKIATLDIRGRHRVIHKLSGRYKDIDSRFYNRIRMQVNQLNSGLLIEKDSGEQNYADFVTGFLEYQHRQLPIKIIVGQFTAQTARGLVLWSPYGLRKSGDVLAPVKHRGQGIHPYSSTDENAAFAGAAVEFQNTKCHTFIFASHHQVDAHVSDAQILSFSSTGYHRSAAEIQRKNTAVEEAAGTRVQYRSEFLDLGMTVFANCFSFPLAEDLADRAPGVTGGIDYNYRSSFFNFFGETAFKKNAWAHIYGLCFEHKNFSSIWQWRSFAADYHQPQAFAFASDKTNNEKGIYLGVKYDDKRFSISAFLDQYQHPSEITKDLQPGEAFDLLAMFEYHFMDDADLTFRYKKRQYWQVEKAVDSFGNETVHYCHSRTHIMRVQLDVDASRAIELRTRAELSFQDHAFSYGSSLYQHICFGQGKMKMHCRWTMFDVPNYALRLYQFENDMPGLMNNRLLYGRGSRFFVLLSCHFTNFSVNTKFSQIVYNQNPTNVGIEFSKEKQFSFQIDWKIK